MQWKVVEFSYFVQKAAIKPKFVYHSHRCEIKKTTEHTLPSSFFC